MLVLALDTSTTAVTVAVADGSDVRAERTEVAPNRHGELVAPLVDGVLRAARAGRRDLAAVAVGLGPGPFTGLRVGLVTAAALADALEVPAYGVCSLDVLAARHDHDGRYVVVTDARRREVYWADYDPGAARRAGPGVDRPTALAERFADRGRVRVCGAGALLYPEAFAGCEVDAADPYPSAGALAVLVAPRVARADPGDVLTPLYLRRPDAVPPGPRKAVTPA